VLHDCRAVLVSGVGEGPRAILAEAGVAPVEMGRFIELGLQAVYSGSKLTAFRRRLRVKIGRASVGEPTSALERKAECPKRSAGPKREDSMCGMGGKCGGGPGGCGPSGGRNLKGTWEKAIEYASVPVPVATASKRVAPADQRGAGVRRRGLLPGEEFVRITVQGGDGSSGNCSHDWSRIGSIQTFSTAQP